MTVLPISVNLSWLQGNLSRFQPNLSVIHDAFVTHSVIRLPCWWSVISRASRFFYCDHVLICWLIPWLNRILLVNLYWSCVWLLHCSMWIGQIIIRRSITISLQPSYRGCCLTNGRTSLGELKWIGQWPYFFSQFVKEPLDDPYCVAQQAALRDKRTIESKTHFGSRRGFYQVKLVFASKLGTVGTYI